MTCPLRGLLWVWLGLVFVLSASSGAVAHVGSTHELRVFPYCKGGNFCGLGSSAALNQQILDAVQEVNVQWAHTGISWWANVLPVSSTAPSGVVKHCDDGDDKYEHAEEKKLCKVDGDCDPLGTAGQAHCQEQRCSAIAGRRPAQQLRAHP